jgi:FkbM family methyltransferase
MITTVEGALQEYKFGDIRKGDIVIDVGACIGGFCIPAARYSDNVFAVEPLWGEELRKNIELNKRKVQIIEAGLGNGELCSVSYGGKSRTIRTMTFKQIMDYCGGCDFLKCDAEGFEWFIRPDQISGIRRLELEIHRANPSGNKKADLIERIRRDFDWEIKRIPFTHNAFGVISGRKRA